MRKTSVYLSDEQAERLARPARDEGRSQADILRDAIERYESAPGGDRNFTVAAGFARRLRRVTGASRAVIALPAAGFVLGAAPAAAVAAKGRACEPVRNPYPNTRYEGVDLTRIRTLKASCRTARRVARRAHYKALGLTPPPDGIRRFTWKGWRVRGDLRGAHERYVARKGTRRVRWRF